MLTWSNTYLFRIVFKIFLDNDNIVIAEIQGAHDQFLNV